MDQATKDKLKAAGLEAVVALFEKLSGDVKAATDKLTLQEDEHKKAIAQKDAVITQKNEDIVRQRQGYAKKLAEMTDEEKAAMSEQEIKLQQGLEDLAARTEAFEKGQKETLQKEVDARKERAITKLAGNNPELKQKIIDAFGKIVDHDKAQTEEEIGAIASSAFNMLGIPKADPIREAVHGGGDGGAGGEIKAGEFADSQAGKDLGAAMGLPVAPKA